MIVTATTCSLPRQGFRHRYYLLPSSSSSIRPASWGSNAHDWCYVLVVLPWDQATGPWRVACLGSSRLAGLEQIQVPSPAQETWRLWGISQSILFFCFFFFFSIFLSSYHRAHQLESSLSEWGECRCGCGYSILVDRQIATWLSCLLLLFNRKHHQDAGITNSPRRLRSSR